MQELTPFSNSITVAPPIQYSSKLNRELIFDFFLCFARAEYALKCAKYVRAPSGYVEANWTKFAERNNVKFNPHASTELSFAVDYLIHNPPKKQVLKDGELSWADCEFNGGKSLQNLISLIRIVRNNLFHGGKFPMQPIPELSRDEKLLRSSLIVLSTVMQLNPKTSRFFSEEI